MPDILRNNIRTVMDAQRARGVETEGGIPVRAGAFLPVLVPLILNSVTGAEEKLLTLEARGFSARCEKTRLFRLERSGLERQVKSIAIIITALILCGRIALWLL